METIRGWPFPATVAALFVIVLLRANATYWLGRAAQRGVRRTRLAGRLSAPRLVRAERLVAQWGAPLVTASFLTVGIQTVVNLAAGTARMPLRRYLPAVAFGGLIWALLYATVGFVTFAAWRRLYELSPAAAVTGAGLLAVSLVAFLWRQLRSGADQDERTEVKALDDRAG